MSIHSPKLPFVTYLVSTSPGFAVSQMLISPALVVAASLSPDGDKARAQFPSPPVYIAVSEPQEPEYRKRVTFELRLLALLFQVPQTNFSTEACARR